MRRSKRIATVAAALTVVLLSEACSAEIEPVLGPLAPATASQFADPISVTVTSGSDGPEGVGSGTFYWMTSPAAQIRVTNTYQTSPVVKLTMLLKSPPCPGGLARMQIRGGRSVINRQVDSVTGGTVTLPLNVPPGRSALVGVTVLSPWCHFGSDRRKLFAGIYQLGTS